MSVAQGRADYAVDIVNTGSTVLQNGLSVIGPPLFKSDGVLVANRAFDLEQYLPAGLGH